MRDIPRIVTGLVLVLLGCFFTFIPLFSMQNYGTLVFGVIILIIGVVILLNKKENKIEEIRKR